MGKRHRSMGLSVLLGGTLLLTACSSGMAGAGSGESLMESSKLAESIRQKYDEKYEYTEPLRNVARDEKLELISKAGSLRSILRS